MSKNRSARCFAAFFTVLLMLASGCTGGSQGDRPGALSPETQAPEAQAAETAKTSELPDPSPSHALSDKPECKILKIGDGVLSVGGHASGSDIASLSESLIEESRVGEKKSFELLGKSYELEYSDTIKCQIGNFDAYRYDILSCNGKTVKKGYTASVVLYPDDSIDIISFKTITYLDIGSEPSDEDFYSALIDAFSEIVDFETYEERSVTKIDRYYYVTFGLSKGGIMLDNYASFTIDEDGAVVLMMLKNKVALDFESIPEDFDINDYADEIEATIKEICGDDYEGWRVSDSEQMMWTNIGGKTALTLMLSISRYYGGSIYSDGQKIAICFE